MNALWIDEGQDPNYELLHGRGFTHLYFAHRDSRLTPAYLEGVRARGFTVGIYWASSWDAGQTGMWWAQMLSARFVSLGGTVKRLDVQANIEEHQPARIADFLFHWRQRRPWAQTSLAIEGFQGGWLKEIRQQIIDARVTLVPEAYDGAMNPFDPLGVVDDLTYYGFPASIVTPFHDAARLYRGWRGFAFTQARLA